MFGLLVEFLLKACALACAVAQKEQAGPADFIVAFNYNLVDARRPVEESTLHTHPVARNTTDSEGGAVPILVGEENGPFEFLDTFPVTFLDFYVDTYSITRGESRDFRIYRSFYRFHQISHLTHLAVELRLLLYRTRGEIIP